MFYRKQGSESATVCGREYAIYAINKSLRNRGTWRESLEQGREVPYTFRHGNWKPFSLDTPIVNIKTTNQMHKWHGHEEVVDELLYWGKPQDVTGLFA
jgi:hypothetical protein